MTQSSPEWNERYKASTTPWDTGRPSGELQRLMTQFEISPCRTLDIGCGTGTNAVYLAQQGFEVTAVDFAALAVERARQRARDAGVTVDFRVLDLTDPGESFLSQPPFEFVFDRGVYHVLRRHALDRLLELLERVTRPGSLYVVLAGNANESGNPEVGPPRVSAAELCADLGGVFRLVQLREFSFDEGLVDGKPVNFLAWSATLRRR